MQEVFLIIKDFSINNPDLVTWSVAGVILILGITLQDIWIKEFISEWKLNYLLKHISHDSLHNVTIPDGMDGSIFIEHLILTPEKILLLGVKKYRGLIFAAEKIDLWTQVIGNKSYKFENPLHQLENDVLALNLLIKNSKVEEKVLFINGSEFPKGKPENIVTISDIKEWRESNAAAPVSDALREDWKCLLDLAGNNNMNADKGVLLVDDEKSPGMNLFSLITIMTMLLFWLAWRLM